MGRAPCCDKSNVKKGPWSPEEDTKLKSYIDKHGTGGNWIALPQKIGLRRCGKSCRLRWLNYLRPNIRHGGFSEEEDNIICSFYITIGSRWSIIASQLPGRTDNDIKNYWNTRLKKRFLGNELKRNCDYMNMMKHDGANKGAMATSVITGNNHDIHGHDLNPHLPNKSLCFKGFLFKLDDQFSSEEDSFASQTSSSSTPSALSMDYTAPQDILQTRFGTDQSDTGFQAMQGQSEINNGGEFLFPDEMTCGASNTGSWGYFTSLMTLGPPSCSSDEFNIGMHP